MKRTTQPEEGGPKVDTTQERGGGVQSLARAFSLLEEVAHFTRGISLADLSKRLGLHSSTTFHIARTMVALGYIRQDAETKRYHVGSKLFTLAGRAEAERALLAAAAPILEDVARRTGGTVHLALLAGGEVSVVARREGHGPFQLQEGRGGRRPGHATALGKVLLAFAPVDVVEDYLATHPLDPLTPNTITDIGQFRAELEKVRRTAVAYDDGEFNADIRCVSVPVRGPLENVIATIGVSAPVWQKTAESAEANRVILDDAAAALRDRLSGVSAEDVRAALNA